MDSFSPLRGISRENAATSTSNIDSSGKTPTEKKIEEVRNSNLTPQSSSGSSSWKFWNWFNWGKQNPPQHSQSDQSEEEDKVGSEGSATKEQSEEFDEPEVVAISDDSANIPKVTGHQRENDRGAEFANETQKTSEVGQSWLGRWGQSLVSTVQTGIHYVTTAGTQYVANEIQSRVDQYENKIVSGETIASSKEEMLISLQDPQFVDLFELTRNFIVRLASNKIDENFNDDGLIAKIILAKKELVLKVIEVNLAKGFVNLANQIVHNRAKIPNYDQQSSLVSLLSLFSQKLGENLNANHLADIERKYRDARENLPILTKKLFPNNDNKTQEFIQEYIRTTNDHRRSQIESALFPDIRSATGQREDDIEDFLSTLSTLNKRHQELNDSFNQVADDILIYLFPNKFADMELPYIFQGMVGEKIYDFFVKGLLVDILQESYEPLEINPKQINDWKEGLKTKLNAPDLDIFTEAPSAFLIALIKNYIQSDTRLVGSLTLALDRFLDSHNDSTASTESQKRRVLFSQLSQESFADWLIKSFQDLIHTQDPHLLGIGEFIKQNNLALAIITKFANFMAPQNFDDIVNTFESLQADDAINKSFWKDFVKDLPIPPLAKKFILPFLVEKSEDFIQILKKLSPEWHRKIYEEAEQKIKSYSHGDELLAITKTISDQVVELIIEQNIELVNRFGFGDSVEEWAAQYLPGIEIKNDFNHWLQTHISALNGDQTSAQSVLFLKQQIQSILQKALVNTIEKNFQNNSQDYVAQLLTNLRQAFSDSFKGFDQSQRDDIAVALSILDEMEEKKKQMEKLKNQINDQPKNLTPDQEQLIKAYKHAYIRHLQASESLSVLIEKRTEILAKLNDEYEDEPWTINEIPFVKEALLLHKELSSQYSQTDNLIRALKNQIDQAENASDRDQKEMLLTLLEMSSDELQMVIDLLHTEDTIENGQREIDDLSQELKDKELAFRQEDLAQINNREEWNLAKDWVENYFNNRREIERLGKEIKNSQNELSLRLKPFQGLSEKLSTLLGIGQKDDLELPSEIQNFIWPYIESAKNELLPRLLFEHLHPVILPELDIDINKNRLEEFYLFSPLFVQLAKVSAQEVRSRIANYVTSYRPNVEQFLKLMGVKDPSSQEISSMEEALKQKMIELGKLKISASNLESLFKGVIPQDKEQAVSVAVEQLITQGTDQEISKDQLIVILLAELAPANKKEEKQIEKTAQSLARTLNQFLLNRGKFLLQAKDLIDAYQTQLSDDQKDLPSDLDKVQQDIQSERLLEKIKRVVLTPEEIAGSISDLIPGATDLQALIGPQLQEVIVGNNPAFQANRETLENYLEGVLLQFYLKIAEANAEAGQSIFTIMTRKLNEWSLNVKAFKGKVSEEHAQDMIDEMMSDIFGILSEKDLVGIPPAIRRLGFEKLKEQIYQQLTSPVIAIMELAQNKAKLETLSGSKFLGNWCKLIGQDLFYLLPFGIRNYSEIANQLFLLISGNQPTSQQLDQLSQELITLVNQEKVTEIRLIEAYSKVTQSHFSAKKTEDLRMLLRTHHIVHEIRNVMISPQEIFEIIGKEFPFFDAAIQQEFANELNDLLHHNPNAYQNLSSFAGSYIESMLVKLFVRIAEKNPAQDGKDSLVILQEKLIATVSHHYQQSKLIKLAIKNTIDQMGNQITPQDVLVAYHKLITDQKDKLEDSVFLDKVNKILNRLKSPDTGEIMTDHLSQIILDNFAQDLDESVMKNILGLDSVDAFEGIPPVFKEKTYSAIKGQLGTLITLFQKKLVILLDSSEESIKAVENVKRFGIVQDTAEPYAKVFTDDLANFVMNFLPEFLTEMGGEKMKSVNLITKNIEAYLEELARGNVQMAKHLLAYTKGEKLQQILGDQLKQFSDSNTLTEEKTLLSEVMSNFFLMPINRFLTTTWDFAEEKGEIFSQRLCKAFFDVATADLRIRNDAKVVAKNLGHEQVLHQDYITAAGDNWHPAVPQKAVTHQHAIDVISQRLYGLLSPGQQKASGKIYGKLTPEQALIWEKEQDSLRKTFFKMNQDHSKRIKNLNLDDIITAIDSINQKVTGAPLTKSQRHALRAIDKKGFNLKEIIRHESKDPDQQRYDRAYHKCIDAVMFMLFPHGQEDLTFIPEISREKVWIQFETNLFPSLLSMLTELILDPDVIKQMVLKGIETSIDSMKGEIKVESKKPASPMDALDQSAGNLVNEVLRTVKLPDWIRKKIVDPKTGLIPPAMAQSIGKSLRKQLTDTFFTEKLQMGLESLVERDENGRYLLQPTKTLKTDAEKKAKEVEREMKRVKMDRDLFQTSRELVDVSISYFIRSTWIEAQARFDEIVYRAFGKIGSKLKGYLDAIFGFIFFKLMGTFLSIIFSPMKGWIKEKIYQIISLDENRDMLLAMFTEAPPDQPFSSGGHVVYNENLIFKLYLALKSTVEETLDVPVIPMAKDKLVDDALKV